MPLYKILALTYLIGFSATAYAGSMVSAAPKIAANSMEPKYFLAAQKATNAFLIQSGVGAQIDKIELKITKKITKKASSIMGKPGVIVVGTTLFVARSIRDKKLTTKVFNPLLGHSHIVSVGSDGFEVSNIKSSFGTNHWIRFDTKQKEGNRYATGLSFSF